MAPQETLQPKKRRGPAPSGQGTPVQVRLQPELLEAVDAWIARHPEANISRPEAIRQILAGALATQRPATILPNFTTGRDIV